MNELTVVVNPDRLLADLRRLRQFGACGNGVVRQSLSPIDLESRRWLCERMDAAGLDAVIDGFGTVMGRSRQSGKALLIGSHTDTQPTGGWLDGALGVMYGVEVARALAECKATQGLALDVAAWIDEEGAFFGFVGSRAFCGELPDDAFEATNEHGQTLREALREAGLESVAAAKLEPGRYIGYVEAHIEQGPYLEEEGNRIGVVTSIVGARNLVVGFEGQQNHAGTTPMPRRRDAGRTLVEFAHAVHEEFPKHVSERTVWTIGEIDLEPGAMSIVPGRARMNLQFRDQDEALLDRLEKVARDLIARADTTGPVKVTVSRRGDRTIAAPMDPALRAHLERAAEQHATGTWTSMPSAAAHDAQILAQHIPSAMLFVPSIEGISHAFEEDTSDDDIVLGCQVLASAAAAILSEHA